MGSTHSKSGHCRARCAHPRPICIPPIRNGERRRERRGGNGELTISRGMEQFVAARASALDYGASPGATDLRGGEAERRRRRPQRPRRTASE